MSVVEQILEDLAPLIEQALNAGSTREAIVASIKAAMVTAADAQMRAELGQ